MDAMLCSMWASTQETKVGRSHSMRVRLGVVTAMAIVIEYYVPEKFPKRSNKWIPPEQRGGSFPFKCRKRNSLNVKTLRLVHASE